MPSPMSFKPSFKPAKGTHKRQKAKAERVQAKADSFVYDWVTARDGGICRVCGEGSGEIHRHHLKGRQFTTKEDVCLLCDLCHDGVHVRVGGKWLDVRGNADRPDGLIVRMRIKGEWKVCGRA
jgi:hypothetical protein